jgi:transcriptional regulator with XRE-family HTH domain
MTVAARLRRTLADTGHTVASVAEMAGMARQQVHPIVTGKIVNPGILTVERIVGAAGSSMVEFYRDAEG